MCFSIPYNFRCRIAMVIRTAAYCVVSLTTVVLNVLVLFTFAATHNWNSQQVYKSSLAISDILIGILLLPLAIWDFCTHFIFSNVNGQPKMNVTSINNNLNETRNFLVPIPLQRSYFTALEKHPYYEEVRGFSSSLFIFTAIYCMAAASIDRFIAIAKPLSYTRHVAKRMSKRAVLAIWLAGIVYSCGPRIFRSMGVPVGYQSMGTVAFMQLEGMEGMENDDNSILIISLSMLLVPLIIVWVLSIFTFNSMKNSNRSLRKFQQRANNLALKGYHQQAKKLATKERQVEGELARTLRLIVAAFTVCFLPAILSFGGMLVPSVHRYNVEVFSIKAYDAYTDIEDIAQFLLYFNGLFNFFIYNARNNNFRKTLRRVIAFRKALK